jgi:asparagine synthase (glutamine-hydrolysing)
LAAKRLPQEIVNSPKRGFSIPAARWLRQDLKSNMEEKIFRNSSFINQLLNKKQLKRMWKEHQTGSRDHSVFLWGVFMFGLWEKLHQESVTKTCCFFKD